MSNALNAALPLTVDLRSVLIRAADALHDAAAVGGAPGLYKSVGDEVRALIAVLDEVTARVADEDFAVLGHCPHGVDLDREFCPKGCRV